MKCDVCKRMISDTEAWQCNCCGRILCDNCEDKCLCRIRFKKKQGE